MRIFSFLACCCIGFFAAFGQAPPLEAETHADYEQVKQYLRNSELDSALATLGELLSHSQQDSYWQKRWFSDSLHVAGVKAYDRRDIRLAESLMNQALSIREALSGQVDSSVAESYNRLGLLYRRSGEYEKSQEAFERSLALKTELHGADHILVAYTLNNLGNLAKTLNEPQKAIDYFQKALDIFRTPEPDFALMEGEATVYNNLGIIYHRRGEYAKGEEYVLKGLRIRQKVLPEDHHDLGTSWYELCRLAIDQGDYALSLRYADSVLMTWGNQQVPERTYLYIVQGVAHAERGDYDQALHYQRLALEEEKKRSKPNPMVVAGITSNLANIALIAGRLDECEQYVQESLSMQQAVFPPGHPAMKMNYMLLGQLYYTKGETAKAIRYYKQSFIEMPGRSIEELPDNADQMISMGSALLKNGQTKKAFENFERAISIYQNNGLEGHPKLATAYENMASAYRQLGDYERGIAALAEGRKVLGIELDLSKDDVLPRLPSPYSRSTLLENLQQQSQIYLARAEQNPSSQEDLLLAWQSLKLGVDLIDSMRLSFRSSGAKSLLHQKTFPVYEGAIRLVWQLYQQDRNPQWLEEAFRLSERNKSMLLFESLRDHNALAFAGIPDSILQRERRISLDLALAEKKIFESDQQDAELQAEYRRQLLSLRTDYEVFTARLEREYPKYYHLKYSHTTPSLEEIQAQLPDHEVAWISYFLGEQQAFAFVIQKDAVRWFNLVAPSQIQQEVEVLRKAIVQPVSGQEVEAGLLSGAAYKLYNQLIAPLQPLPQKLKIIPDGVLGYLPFDVLLTEKEAEEGAYRDWPYLILQHQLSDAYSAAVHLQKHVSPPNRLETRVLAFAPSFSETADQSLATNRSILAPLSYNQEEVNKLQQFFPGTAFYSQNANEATFKKQAPHYPVIHIASHAYVNDQNPLYSHIQFTPGADSTEDGILELAELFNLQLNAELVVLSACETGLGKLQRGEGIVSLARGMTYAGAQSVLTTLWQVNDAATADLMGRFYAELEAGEEKDAALRQAKLDYLQASDQLSAHPFYWAAYIPIGSMASLSSFPYTMVIGFGLVFILLLASFVWWRKKGFAMPSA